MLKTQKSDAAKDILWPGATPFLALVSRQKTLPGLGVAPGHCELASVVTLRFFRVSQNVSLPTFVGNSRQNLLATSAKNRWQFLPRKAMPLFKSSAPTGAKRKYYIRIDNPPESPRNVMRSSSRHTLAITSSAKVRTGSSRERSVFRSVFRSEPEKTKHV